ncbi:MAG: hypothetical protein ACI9FG_001371 [Crocinitomicaceae bacterium]|jgi:hypothetical protein
MSILIEPQESKGAALTLDAFGLNYSIHTTPDVPVTQINLKYQCESVPRLIGRTFLPAPSSVKHLLELDRQFGATVRAFEIVGGLIGLPSVEERFSFFEWLNEFHFLTER